MDDVIRRSVWARCATRTSFAALVIFAGAMSVEADDRAAISTIATHVQTDELVTPRQMPRVKTRKPAVKSAAAKSSDSDGVWLFDYVARLLGSEPEAANRPRVAKSRATSAPRRTAATQPVAVPGLATPLAPDTTRAKEPATQRVTILPSTTIRPIVPVAPVAPEAPVAPAAPTQAATPASTVGPATAAVAVVKPAAASETTQAARPTPSIPLPKAEMHVPAVPIVTGALGGLAAGRDASARIVTPDASEALVEAAERAQARADLVKLEFASRTYAERRVSGQSVFDLRLDWKVLERARDALSESEIAAADAAGFEANAYVNDTTRTIVVAVAGSEDLRRDFLQADIWDALIRAQMPQQFFLAKTYTRSVLQRYQSKGYTAECVGHSLGGGACAYVASELGIRAVVVNPISAGKLPSGARHLVTNYVVDGEIANLVYGARGNEIAGDVQRVSGGRAEARERAVEKFGPLAGPVLVVKTLSEMVKGHKVERALDLIATHAGIERPR